MLVSIRMVRLKESDETYFAAAAPIQRNSRVMEVNTLFGFSGEIDE